MNDEELEKDKHHSPKPGDMCFCRKLVLRNEMVTRIVISVKREEVLTSIDDVEFIQYDVVMLMSRGGPDGASPRFSEIEHRQFTNTSLILKTPGTWTWMSGT